MFAVINTANRFNTTPSRVLAIEDEYTAFCFDEACMYILFKIDEGEEPRFEQHYSSFRDMYKNIL